MDAAVELKQLGEGPHGEEALEEALGHSATTHTQKGLASWQRHNKVPWG